MNFIIAVISESYEKVMQKLVAQLYMVKVQLIAERESLMTADELENKEYFPQYLIVRRPTNISQASGEEWQGFIKDLKSNIQKQVTKSKVETQALIKREV